MTTTETTETTMAFTPEELDRMAQALLMARSMAEKEARVGLGGENGENCRRAGVAFNDLLVRVDRARGRREPLVEQGLARPYHGPTQKLAENLDPGDVLSTTPRVVVDGDPVIGPIPSFGVNDAVVVPVRTQYVGRRDEVSSVMAFQPGQLVTLAE